jgi:hypothetical protein
MGFDAVMIPSVRALTYQLSNPLNHNTMPLPGEVNHKVMVSWAGLSMAS